VRLIVAGVIVMLLILAGARAEAQVASWPTWTPEAPRPLESDGEVVLTFSSWSGARVRYMTFDGTCAPPPGEAQLHQQFKNTRCEPEARALDYTAVDSEVACTLGQGACSVTIRIQIVDDDLAEGTEAFTVIAWEEPNRYNTNPYGGPTVIVRIIDDDGNDGSVVATTATTAPESQSSSSAPVLTVAPTPAPIEDLPVPDRPGVRGLPVPDLAVAVASSELRPGPGELTSEDSPRPAPGREGGGGGSASSWLAPGLGTAAAAAAVGALAFLRRRKQWSPTRP